MTQLGAGVACYAFFALMLIDAKSTLKHSVAVFCLSTIAAVVAYFTIGILVPKGKPLSAYWTIAVIPVGLAIALFVADGAQLTAFGLHDSMSYWATIFDDVRDLSRVVLRWILECWLCLFRSIGDDISKIVNSSQILSISLPAAACALFKLLQTALISLCGTVTYLILMAYSAAALLLPALYNKQVIAFSPKAFTFCSKFNSEGWAAFTVGSVGTIATLGYLALKRHTDVIQWNTDCIFIEFNQRRA